MGGTAIIKAVRNNKSLLFLDLGGESNARLASNTLFFLPNPFIRELSKTIRQNYSLEEVYLNPNEPGAFSKKIIEQALAQNSTMKKVEYSYTPGKNSWHSFREERRILSENETFHELRDTVVDYSLVLLSRLIRKIAAEKTNFDLEKNLPELKQAALKKTQEILISNLDHQERIDFAKHWHKPFQQVQSQKLRNQYGESWPSLFGEKEIEIPEQIFGKTGYKFVVRTTPEELKKEGENLKHCVGGYAGKCVKGESHIVSIVNQKGESTSTAEITIEGEKTISLVQHRSARNSPPNPDESSALSWLQQQVETEKIKIDHQELKKHIASDQAPSNTVLVSIRSKTKNSKKSFAHSATKCCPAANSKSKN